MLLQGRWSLILPGRTLRGKNLFVDAGAALLASILAGTAISSRQIKFGTSEAEPALDDTNLIGTIVETASATPTSSANEYILSASGTFDTSALITEMGIFMNSTLIARFTFPEESVTNATTYAAEWRLPFKAG